MTDEHATHLGYADAAATNARRESLRRAEVLAELEHHMVELNNTVRRVSVARDEIAMLEASADATVICTASTGGSLRRGMSVDVPVAKQDVLEKMRIERDEVQRTATRHLEAIAAFLERK